VAAAGLPASSYVVDDQDDIWGAVRHFFTVHGATAHEGPRA
jgi:hypothetical protein